MKTKYTALIGAGILSCLAGCVSNPLALAPVGPDAVSRALPGRQGYLEVFTATQTIDVDFQAYFHPHMGYDINDAAGRSVRFVQNHTSNMDESPELVTLPPGNYEVVAESTWCGLVGVPVVVQKGKTTVVHLDGNAWRPPHASGGQLVYLPNGEVVGWSSGRNVLGLRN
jgi:hypothetical protein